ncbi:hypothetical protein BD310DRAFT_568741 [Dichomitus squalens]|uniref:GST N-terminal domain-containing protein n=1 Tax=Dichomitus squalens TaxID=114155 RepID=A0A4Q9PRU4_9APHY|nr:hypothetical protein BD310DRAFT_568741 [Dichomitus squalens]
MSETKRITLYSAVDSPFPHRVRLALEEAKATYDIIWIDLMAKPEWYEKKVYHGEGRVPYLVYGGPKLNPDEAPSGDAVGIPESSIILEFLADLFPAARLLPADPVTRSQVRVFCEAVNKKLLPAWFPSLFMGVPTDGLFAVLDDLQKKLPAKGGYFFGEWTIADATILPILLRMEHNWRLKPFSMTEAEIAKAQETWNSPRFARFRQYLEDNKKRESVLKTWDEDAIAHAFGRRLDRFKKTGIINSDVRVPIPAAQQ